MLVSKSSNCSQNVFFFLIVRSKMYDDVKVKPVTLYEFNRIDLTKLIN